ncbi:MAG: M48 family metalloprotease [Treponema sp.]|jgi:predicted Zn-dependent protease|nr:M48 family metalloprotease [Treponema sp.]
MSRLPVFILIAACFFTQPVFVQGQSSSDDDFSLVDAYYLGRAVAANILAAYKPYTGNPEATRYLNEICQTLIINSSLPPAFNGYHVMILDSNEFNAFATTGGHIFLTKRLIESANSEDMLAAVIAHELSHIAKRHSIIVINEMRFTAEMSSIANRASSLAGAPNSASLFRDSISTTMDTLMKVGYSKNQEYEADMDAVVMLRRAGYHPNALLDMLNILQRQSMTQKSGLFSTHPSPAERIANVQGLQIRVTDTRQYRESRFKNIKF